METLRCRAYTRQWLQKQDREVEEMEERVGAFQQQLSAVLNENQRSGTNHAMYTIATSN